MEYNIQLLTYKSRDSLMYCPNCGKKEFKPYVIVETGEIVHPTCGRCNREENCGYHYPPKQYFKDNPETKTNLRSTERIYTVSSKVVKPISTIPFEWISKELQKTLSGNRSVFMNWLITLFDADDAEMPIFTSLAKDYYLTTKSNNYTVFWQIDKDFKVRTGQALCHNLKGIEGCLFMDCKRDHDRPPIWMHKDKTIAPNFNLKQCLFGEHLLSVYPDHPVALVEGQKNAIIGRGVDPKYIWLATCSKNGFKSDMLMPLKGRNVVLFPDLDAHTEWVTNAKMLSKNIGFKYDVFTEMIDIARERDKQQKMDISDFLLNKFEVQNYDKLQTST